MTISCRYGVAIAILLALALVPTVIHSYGDARFDDGRRAAAVARVLSGMNSTPTDRRPGWGQSHLDTDDWIERIYDVQGVEGTLFVARSYDAKRLYHHPELAVLRGFETTPAGVTRNPERPDVPLHVISLERNGRKGVAVYALRYENAFIENPVLFQLRTAVELLVSRRRPLTLFMASALDSTADNAAAAPATRLLLAAIADFERQAVTPRDP
jgi:hypothetical protein